MAMLSHARPIVGVFKKSIFSRFVNFWRKFPTKTGQRLQERVWDTSTKGRALPVRERKGEGERGMERFGFWFWSLEFGVSGFGCRVLGSRNAPFGLEKKPPSSQTLALGVRVWGWGPGFRVLGLRGLESRVWVQDIGFRV